MRSIFLWGFIWGLLMSWSERGERLVERLHNEDRRHRGSNGPESRR